VTNKADAVTRSIDLSHRENNGDYTLYVVASGYWIICVDFPFNSTPPNRSKFTALSKGTSFCRSNGR
jgi:hypothetical protein